MPTYSEISITFTSDWVDGAVLRIVTNDSNNITLNQWRFVPSRTGAGYVTTGTPTATVGETSALNFKTAFDLDFPTGYVTSVVNNVITIQSETINEDFIRAYNNLPSNGSLTFDVSNTLTDAYQHKVKYYINYCDDFNTTRNVFILKKGHTGGATELLADVNPISIDYESADDFKFSPIRPSQAEVFMIFGGDDNVDFEEFWVADEREYKIQDVKSGTVEWSGYVIPSGFQYEFKGGLYYASIQASDGLSTLEALTFIDDNQDPYGIQDLVYNNDFEFPFSLIITEILKKLELDLDLWTCVDSYESSMTKVGDVREADPLSASFVNVKTYIKLIEDKNTPYWYGSGEEWNCKDVLENILYIFGAKLYQEFGVWRVKSINADVDYGTGATQRYWRKYNTVGTYLEGYEVVNDEINIPCNDSTKYLVGNDHVMSMDDVYKAFRMNYEYTFLREGDSPLNTLRNGNFVDFDDSSVYSSPLYWSRVRESARYGYLRIKSVDVNVEGFTKGVEFGNQAVGASTAGTTEDLTPYSALLARATPDIKSGDKMYLNIWDYYTYKHVIAGNFNSKTDQYTMMYRCVVISYDNEGDVQKHYLRNSDADVNSGFTWEKSNSKNGDPFDDTTCFYLLADKADNYDSDNDNVDFWYNHKYDLPDAPASGTVYFLIHGIAIKPTTLRGRYFPGKFPCYVLKDGFYQRNNSHWYIYRPYSNYGYDASEERKPQVTGAFLGIIPSGDDIPEQSDYIYTNTNSNYTLQVDPITVYNGDVQDAKHISNIIVPTNVSGGKNFWDDLGDTYGSSSLGLLTVREIMRQYQKPYRILEGTIKAQDARFGSVYTFETIPNVRFFLQRGSFNKQKQYVENATFVQLTDDTLPDGGTEGGNTLDPNWVETGNTWCRVDDVTALNDGYVIVEEIDMNPNSETYQETRETPSTDQDLVQCPLGEPRQYYWGSDDVFLDTSALTFSPFYQLNPSTVIMDMDNDEGNYLYFVHLKSLGVVERIYTNTSPNNVLSDWVYLADETIDGYIYRVLRTDYVMTEFTGFTHKFKFN